MQISLSLALVASLSAQHIDSPPGRSLSDASLDEMRRYFTTEVAHGGFPGGTLAVVQGNRIVLSVAAGVSDLEHGTAVTPDTIFCIGSLTKSFTATALLQLRDQGLVDLDAPVTRYLPWFRVATPGLGELITLRQLLNHTSGLPTNSHGVVWLDPDGIRGSIDHAVRALRDVSLHHLPGTTYEYANMNYVVLGRVVEEVSGTSWHRYLEAHVFVPAGMTQTTTNQMDVDTSRLARSYWPEFGRLAPNAPQTGDFMGPASNILTSAPDLARYAMAHLGTGATLLAPATLRESHLGGVERAPGERYQYGWINSQFHGATVIHHGGAAGHAADVFLVPERQLAVVTLFGAYSHVQNDEIAWGIVALALGHRPPPIEGPSELSVLLWTSRGMVAAGLFCPATLAIRPVWRRRRRDAWGRSAYVARAVILVAASVGFWLLVLVAIPRNVPEIPLPFGFRGWFYDLAAAAVAVLFTSSSWALWSVASVFLRARAFARIAAAREVKA